MKKKNFLVMLFIILFLMVFINKLIVNKYNINIIQYIYKSQHLTQEEEQWLSSHGPIIYGADQNSPPLRYVDAESGQYKGVSVDLIQSLSVELGVEIKFKPEIFSDAMISLKQNKTDIMDLFPSEARKKDYLFSDPIYHIRGVILVPSGNTDIHSYTDLKNKRVALVNGDYVAEFLYINMPGLQYNKTSDMEHAIKLLMTGEADCVVGDEPVISYFIDSLKYKDTTEIVDMPLYEKDVVLAMPKSERKLLSIVNKGILSIKQKKVTEKIQQKWFGISTPISSDVISSKIFIYIGLGIFLFFLIFYFLYYWNERLKREVKHQTEELFESKNDLETIFDGVTYFMVVADRDYNILNANRAFCNYYKIGKTGVNGMKCMDFPELLFNESVKLIMDDTFLYGYEKNGEIDIRDKVFEVGTFPLKDKNKKINKVLMAIKDITDFKINEKRLLQSDKMAAVGQLAAGVAHEIRNPLGLIRNYAYVLKTHLEPNNEKAQKCINIIENSVDRASNIINNLLNFSSISGYAKVKISLREFIQDILNLEGKILRQQNIQELVECDDIECSINQDSLKHIILNLISNSIDAMPQGGTLKIKCFRDNQNLHFTLSDTGTGIGSQDMENIFHPFFTTKAPGKGTGLGLYIAYNEIQKFGGEIKVESQIGNGTTFKLILPIGDD